jgi:amino acid adenylation domain-containing protein
VLTAYVVFQDEPPTLSELRRGLARTLPEVMLPGALVVLEALPLTPSGKVDRRSLPEPAAERPELEAAFEAPSAGLEAFLAGLFEATLKLEGVGATDDFFELGGSSLTGAVLINRLQQELGEIVQVVTIFDAPSVRQLAEYLRREHPRAVERMFGAEALGDLAPRAARRVDAERLAELRSLVPPAPELAAEGTNPPAVFVLAPPRSGTTLLRVMLGGHPGLFAPPELELLGFGTLAERSAELTGRDRFWLEGVIRAVMELRSCDAEAAEALLAGWEREGWSTQRVYRQLQEWLGERRLVDKTPSYALDRRILERAESWFEGAKYVHLLRHPCGMIRSFEEAKLDQIFFRHEHAFERRELAELIWAASHENVLGFLAGVPGDRQLRITFEELVRSPRATMERLCEFLEIAYDPAMVEPYTSASERMTDGPHAASRMLGDVKFHQHRAIDPAVAESWRGELAEGDLGEPTRELAVRLGYALDDGGIRRQGLTEAPLSFGQERLWLLDQIEPGNPAYNMPFAVRFRGVLEVGALHRSLAEVVRRHEVLRTTFTATDAGPVQVIHRQMALELPRIDLSGLSDAGQDREAARVGALDAAQPFDLEGGPLLRTWLVRLGEELHELVLDLHHVVSDGWSIRVLTREVAALYEAAVRGERSPLTDLGVQYADYAAWQRRWLEGERLAGQVDYWRERLAGLEHGTELPVDRPRPAVRTHRGAHATRVLSPELTQRLRELARRRGATLFVTLLAGFEVVLARWSGSSDVAVGAPIAGRTRPEVEELIGMFLNSLVLRTEVELSASFTELVERVKTTLREAQAHQDVPFEKLLEELKPERDLSRTPYFQIFFNQFDLPSEPIELPGLVLEPSAALEFPAKFDLTIYSGEQTGPDGSQVRFTALYNADLFDPSTLEELLGQYERVLEAVADSPEVVIGEISLVTEAARAELPDPSLALDGSWRGAVHEWIADRAREAPERIAVVEGGAAWSYGELAERGHRLAHRLRRLGVSKGDRVAIWAHRSAELAWAVLGVLESGGTFVCLDPAYPPAYLAALVERAGPKVLLELEAAPALPAELGFAGLERLRLPRWVESRGFLADERSEPPAVEIGPDDVAYLAFTSGSTGEPKGVIGRHGPLSHFLPWQSARFGHGPDDRVSLLSGLAHDPLQRDLFTSLCLGGVLCVPDPARRFESGYLATWLARERVTLTHLTPAMGKLVAERPAGDPTRAVLRRALFVGDVLTRRDVARLRELAPWVTVVNLYGSTETQRAVGYREITGQLLAGGPEVMPLGRGMDDVQLLVINGAGQLAGAREVGEIVVRSPHLSAGYLGDGELTSSRFTANPLTGDPDDRVYRTGDLGRYAVAGDVAFAGRGDQQVKVRGFRVELGEVESHLGRAPGVRQGVAAVDRRGGERLVAYVVAEGELDAESIRADLGRHLPVHMVPSVVVELEALPLTPNGKIDRRALARVELPRAGSAAAEPPGSDLEKRLAVLWGEVLGLDEVGVTDNFFDLGGHSLSLVRLHRRLEETLGREVALVELFRHPNVRALAGYLEGSAAPAEELDAARERARRQVAAARRQRRPRRGPRRGPGGRGGPTRK